MHRIVEYRVYLWSTRILDILDKYQFDWTWCCTPVCFEGCRLEGKMTAEVNFDNTNVYFFVYGISSPVA